MIPLIALGALAGHERLDDSGWLVASDVGLFHDIDYLAPQAGVLVRDIFPQFRQAVAPDLRWLNHCEYCGRAQDDYWLHCEPNAPFLPLTAEAADRIDLIALRAPFEAVAGGLSDGIAFFDAMRRVD